LTSLYFFREACVPARLVHRPWILLVTVFEWFGELALFTGRVARASFSRPWERRELVRQMDAAGAKSFPLVALAGGATGVVLSLQTHDSLARFGAKALLPSVIVFSLIKESGPVITGLIVSGRVGAGIGSELGSMRVTEQIDAMEVSAVNPYKFLESTRAGVHLDAASPHVGGRCFRPVLGMDLHNAIRSNFAAPFPA
jgi:ABC-type transporter Mla maintaining outer membrane lipid asymmetry permease subunit MlaE